MTSETVTKHEKETLHGSITYIDRENRSKIGQIIAKNTCRKDLKIDLIWSDNCKKNLQRRLKLVR